MLLSYDGNKTILIANILQKFAQLASTGCLYCHWRKIQWLVYFERGNVIYVSHSVQPEERFERHLRFVRQKNSPLSSANRTSIKSFLTKKIKEKSYNPEYRTLDLLLKKKLLNLHQVIAFISRNSEECLESLLLAEGVTYQFHEKKEEETDTIFAKYDLNNVLGKVENKLRKWQRLAPEILSPYQCPYLPSNTENSTPLAEKIRQKFGKVLMGFNFRQLASRLYQDELVLAEKLYSLVQRDMIKIRDPQSPFDQLPRFNASPQYSSVDPDKTIICVDDSPSVLQVIKNYLSGSRINVHLISESTKALMEIIQHKPDLILLDVSMPNLDGYQLCKFVRNHSALNSIPIIMVTGKTGWIDRAKAKVSGATDYLVKPFSQDELLQLVSKYMF
ncbi:MAG: response regulator [Microcystaceae cyanobacterium]